MQIHRCFASLAAAGGLLSKAVADYPDIWSLGFGTINAHAILYGPLSSYPGVRVVHRGLIPMILLSNAPQLVLSICYFLYNSVYTCMLAGFEWSRFAAHRKGLRVTSPNGSQRSTYWLQLPWTYSLPLGIASAVLHWLVSQSIFLVRIDVYDIHHDLDPDASFSSCGYSAYALAISIMVGSVMFLALLCNGFRTLDPTMPIVGSCSLAISAACHRPSEDNEASLSPVQWGAVFHETVEKPGHCCFTSFASMLPIEGQRYA